MEHTYYWVYFFVMCSVFGKFKEIFLSGIGTLVGER